MDGGDGRDKDGNDGDDGVTDGGDDMDGDKDGNEDDDCGVVGLRDGMADDGVIDEGNNGGVVGI